MPPTPRRKQQLRGNAEHARRKRLEEISNKESESKTTIDRSIRSTRIITAASKRTTKALSSNPFSRLMRIQKQSFKIKKLNKREQLQKFNDVIKRNRLLKLQQQHVDALEDVEEDEVMDMHVGNSYIPIVTLDNSDVSGFFEVPTTTTNAEREEATFKPKRHVSLIKKRTMFYRIRKLRELAEQMTGGAAYVNTPQQRQMWPIEKQAELLFAKKLTSRQVNHIEIF